jgi:hypothetical protein
MCILIIRKQTVKITVAAQEGALSLIPSIQPTTSWPELHYLGAMITMSSSIILEDLIKPFMSTSHVQIL